jgi:ketosteroid isomerase-like protein
VSSADVEFVRSLYHAWFTDDRETALAGIHPDMEWVEPPEAPEAETHHGAEGIIYATERWLAGFEGWHMEIERVRDLGEGRVIVCARQRGRGRGSSVDVEASIFHLWTVRDGLAVKMQMFTTEAQALESAAASRPADGA